jgi:hypothetical protein
MLDGSHVPAAKFFRQLDLEGEAMGAYVLVAPRLRLARLWAGEELALAADELEGVLLPYPRDLEAPVRRFVKGASSWEELVAEVRGLGLPYTDVWSWTEEPVLRRLRSLWFSGFRLGVECYGPPLSEEARATEELLRLLLRTRVTGKVDVAAWVKLLGGQTPVREGYATLSLRSLGGARVVEWRYPMPPSDSLSLESLSEESVKSYVSYVFDYLMKARNPDEAYLLWLNRNFPSAAEELEKLAKTLGVVGEQPL